MREVFDEHRIQKISENANKLLKYINDHEVTKDALINDYSLQWLVTTPLYNIGEHVYNLSDEYKSAHPEIQWIMISGLRHRLVHDYEGTNWNIIADVVFDAQPSLAVQINNLLK